MGDTAAVPNDIETPVTGLKMGIQGDLHVVELHLYAVKESIMIGGSRGDLVESIDHLDDTV